MFHSLLCVSFNKCFPLKRVYFNYKNNKPWLTTGLLHSIKVKNKLFLKYKKFTCPENEAKYKKYRNALNKLMKRAERNHYEYLFETNKSNLRKKWSIIKQVINKRKSSKFPKYFKINNDECDDKAKIANAFNKYFSNIGSSLASLIPPSSLDPVSYVQQNTENGIVIAPVTEDEISKLIRNLKNSSSGWDNINA
jgi:hypothetical protein